MLIPFVEDQARRRHQIEHGGDDVAVEPRRRPLAELREAVLVLRPQPVHHKRVGPRPALLLRGRSALAGRLAERRRPGQRQHIEVELAGFVLAPILCRGDVGAADEERHSNGGKSHATDNSSHDDPRTHMRISEGTTPPRTFQEQSGNKTESDGARVDAPATESRLSEKLIRSPGSDETDYGCAILQAGL